MAAPENTKDVQLQAESAKATQRNVAEARARAQEPAREKAKLFRCAASSMQMIMPHGKIIVFKDGRFATDRPEEIEFLESEIAAGNTMLNPQVEEVEPEKTLAELKEEIERAAIERYIRDTQGGRGGPSVSQQAGAGSYITTSNVGAETLEQSLMRNHGVNVIPAGQPNVSQQVVPHVVDVEQSGTGPGVVVDPTSGDQIKDNSTPAAEKQIAERDQATKDAVEKGRLDALKAQAAKKKD